MKNTFIFATIAMIFVMIAGCSKEPKAGERCKMETACADGSDVGVFVKTTTGELECACGSATAYYPGGSGGGTGYTGGTGTPTSYGFESGQIYGFDDIEDLGDSQCACADFKVGDRIQPNSCGDGECDNFPNSNWQDNSYQFIKAYARLYDNYGNPVNQNGFPAFVSSQVLVSRYLITGGGLNMNQAEANAMHGTEYTVYLDGVKRTQRTPPIQFAATKYSCIIGYGTGGGTSVLITGGSVMPRQ